MKKSKLTHWIALALIAGIAVGYACNQYLADAAAAKIVAGYISIISDIFLRLIKMIIAPLVLATLVSGLASMGDARTVGRVGFKALGWFVGASFCSLFIGLLAANLLQPGVAVNLPLPEAGAATNLKTSALNLKDFVTHVFPKNIFESLAGNEILQILIFALFFGLALGRLRTINPQAATTLMRFTDDIVNVMLQVTHYVMRFAPLGVFAAVAAVITTQGLGILLVYAKYMGSFFLALATLWCLLITAGFVVLGKDVFRLLKTIRSSIILGFSTASSESVYPQLMEQLEQFGIRKRVTGFVLPLGYSFNLDGSMIYTTFAALFIAQAYNVSMSFTQQLTMLLVLMVSSKGIAGVPRASLVVVAAVLPMFNLPEAGLLLVMGVDQFLDMGRTATNVLGNAIATSVVAKWERSIDGADTSADTGDHDALFAPTLALNGAIPVAKAA